MGVWSGLEPAGVWNYFEELCGIPRGSYHEKAVSDYCVAFARRHGLEVHQDQAWNVVIVKEASPGYEAEETVILQGHLDMVCEKEPDCGIDFEKDGLRPARKGEYVFAEGTTLGGDDGIAVAYALAILEDDRIPHPRLEAVFTTCEEVGMEGAWALDPSLLKGRTLINLDSEEEGILLAGCAGGCRAEIRLPVERERRAGAGALVRVGGLQGGHSGTEIGKGRGNASVLLGKLLAALAEEELCVLTGLQGGRKDNVIPQEAEARILVEEPAQEKLARIRELCGEYAMVLRGAYARTDPQVTVRMEETGYEEAWAIPEESARIFAALLEELPCGVTAMSGEIPGLVQTSLNLGSMRAEDERITLRYSVRSSVEAEKEALADRLVKTAERFGAEASVDGSYPAWEYRKESPLRSRTMAVYEELFGRPMEVQVIHAGLECGILSAKLPGLDCVSIGPDILDIHTTKERMSVPSVERTWRFLLAVLARKC
ncbi:MAG: aminoacyl-histidine dipeptidase [Eubacteriales bacterium]|nr:aminoacyl-histidine dipeptidase [Eubacteriales bacterium]